jgi:hypothetical protein
MSLVLQSILQYPDSCLGTSPHQQGWDTKMEKLSYGGIDVSKDRLDVVVLPEGWFFSVSNDTAGWAELVARLRPLAISAIGLEPSGGYERGIIRALLALGIEEGIGADDQRPSSMFDDARKCPLKFAFGAAIHDVQLMPGRSCRQLHIVRVGVG